MPLLFSCQDIGKSFGARPLFSDIRFAVDEGDRIGLIGPNGSGKTTLLEILAGRTPPDSGVLAPRKQLRLGYVAQDPAFSETATIQQLVDAVPMEEDERESRVRATLGRAGLHDASLGVSSLSGGWRKRLAIAIELLRGPELLLLDEPTNHLDLEGILWLESLLVAGPFASLTVSHDRYFLENTANRMMEINRAYPDGLFRVDGNYSEFLTTKEQFLQAQSKRQESLENLVRREVEWLRRGPKARSTKSKARIDAAGRLIGELADVSSRTTAKSAAIDFVETGRRTKRLIETKHIGKAMGGKPLFSDLSIVLAPGTRLGLLGPNGSGKTTLLRLLAGEIEPDNGEIQRADRVKIVYFDQKREQLDPSQSLRRALAPDSDSVIYRSQTMHVAAWAARFLFRSDQLELAVGRLSGGEQARVLLARLMLQAADVLMLDEPTNDLDIPTLEVLEDSLLEFQGAIALVTHDRYLLDRVSTTILGMDGAGNAAIYADCEQWQDDIARRRKEPERERPAASTKPRQTPKRLTYLENREWEQIEAKIMEADDRLKHAQQELQNPDGLSDPATVQARYDSLLAAQAEVDRLYVRWAELEAKLAG
ncbi:MAG TPA: ABC-F family ATP-binding cassette domain-containing protein [Bryobacteraceae bacterium]|nr:ABC-F family ATP-binding cassette domain-containing protein [Bryobacteraceae bacterium]